MTGGKGWGAAALLATLLGLPGYGAEPRREPRALGTVLLGAGSTVLLNGAPARPGTTLFTGDLLETREGSTAVVRLRSGASLTLAEKSEVAMEGAGGNPAEDKITLHRGAFGLRNPLSQPAWVFLPAAAVLVRDQAGPPAACRFAALGKNSAVANDRGYVEIRGRGVPWILPPGRTAELEAGLPQASGQPAGTVNAAIPAETVQRGQSPPAPLALQSPVYFQDLVRTLNTGRVRIALRDGSFLNIGARSEMRIVKQDVQSQQTAIELTGGKLRGQVQKITKQGGSFEVTTPTAVIGVVGTHLVIAAEAHRTRVWCLEGEVTVRNRNPAVNGVIHLHAGQYTVVAAEQPPGGATNVSPNVLQALVNQTDATAPVPVVGALATVLRAGAAGAGAGSAIAAGVAINRAHNASALLDQAGATLNGAAGTLNNANSNATNAVNAANSANQAAGTATSIQTGILQILASPTFPCGCH